MAWRAELRRRHWYCINQWDAISWYSQYLYDTWYASLTDEDKAKIEERRRKEAEKWERELMNSLGQLVSLAGIMSGMKADRLKREKYHHIYDENGFPIRRD